MKRISKIINEIGISKVKLAKYLGVSRQMVYNYLEMDDINDLPLEKKMKLFTLLNISSIDEIDDIKIDNEFIKNATNIINSEVDDNVSKGSISFSELNSKDSEILNNIVLLLKDRLIDDDTDESRNILKYLSYFVQAIDNTPEIKYILGYIAKTNGFVPANEYLFDEEQQFKFESLFYSAMILYSNNQVSTERLIEFHKKFAHKIEEKQEERLSRTQELNTAKEQALKELGYTELTAENATEVLEKIAEIESRGI